MGEYFIRFVQEFKTFYLQVTRDSRKITYKIEGNNKMVWNVFLCNAEIQVNDVVLNE